MKTLIKSSITSLILIFLLTTLPSSQVAAQEPPGEWVSGIACQNLSSTNEASITLSFYPEGVADPVLTYEDPTPIPANGSRNYYTPSTPPGLPEDFIGSAIVSANQPLTCNVNTQTTGTGTISDPYRLGTSSGIREVDTYTSAYVPQVEKNFAGGWSSYIAIQNAGTNSVEVNINYKDRYGSNIPSATETITIPARTNYISYQTANSNLPDDFLGSATITGDGATPLAIVTNFYNNASDYSTAQMHSCANKIFIPRFVRNFYGYNGGLAIQNVGGEAVTVTINFYYSGSTYTYTSGSIGAGASLFLYAPDIAELLPVDSLNESQRYGSADITASGSGTIIAIVNEDNRGGDGIPIERHGQGSTYNGVLDGTQTTTVFFSQVPRKAGDVWSGGFVVSNTTDSSGTCDITYAGVPAADETDVPLDANGSISRFAPNVSGLPDGFNSSVSVTCTQPVIGIANQAVETGTGRYGDSYAQSNGLNQ